MKRPGIGIKSVIFLLIKFILLLLITEIIIFGIIYFIELETGGIINERIQQFRCYQCLL